MEIRWPDRFEPGKCPVHVRNELAMAAPPDRVWARLVLAERWPLWYSNASGVRVEKGSRPDLAPGATFVWKTFGIPLRSTVREFVPAERIAWDALAPGVDAYHAWLIEPRSGGGCWVLTEETQHGWLARLGDRVMPRRMGKYHQIWLQELEKNALAGFPPPEHEGKPS